MEFEEADKILKEVAKDSYSIEQCFFRHRHHNGDNAMTRYSVTIHGLPNKTHGCERLEASTLAEVVRKTVAFLTPSTDEQAAIEYANGKAPVEVEQEDDGEIEAAPLVTTGSQNCHCDADTAFIASTCGLEPADDLQDWRNECTDYPF